MGLFNDLKKIKNIVTDEIDRADIDKLFNADARKQLFKPDKRKQTSKPGAADEPAADLNTASPATSSVPDTEQPKFSSAAALFEHFDDIITRNFTDYEVRKNVPAKELDPDCHPACTPIQFLFYKGSRPALALVLVQQNTYRGMNVIGTRKICEAQNIDYLRFFREYDNEEYYVVNRIKSRL